MSQTTQRPRTQRPKTKRPKTKKPKKKEQRPKKVQPTYVAITRPIPVPQTTRRTPAVSSTLSPETLMMEEMRNYLADNMPANRRPTVQKPRAQKPRPMVMNPVTLQTPTRRIPMEPYTQSPATKNMIEMRKVIMESGMRPIPRPEDSLGILDLFPDTILTTTPRSEVTTTTTRPIRFPQDNPKPRQRISSARQLGS